MSLNTGIAQDDFETMLLLIQSFYPPGVGARDLRECLLIQLKRDGKQGSLEYKIIQDHMQDLGKRRFPEIARRMGISVEQIQKCANNIAQLDPRPGQIFAAAPQNYVLPDVTVEKIDGQYQVILNGEQIPHLRISNTYKDIMSQDGNGSEVKDYIRDKIRSGKVPDQIDPSTPADDFEYRAPDCSAAKRVPRSRHRPSETDDHGADRRHRRSA